MMDTRVMKVLWSCLLISVGAWAHSQTVPMSDSAAQSPRSLADFGLIYPLSNELGPSHGAVTEEG